MEARKALLAVGLLLVIVASALAALGVVPVTAQTNEFKAVYHEGNIPLDPQDGLWQQLDKKQMPLASQLLAYPTRLDTTPRQIEFTAVHNGTHFAIYLEWNDDTMDVPELGALDQFPDAVAVQFPVFKGEQPYICMGMPDNPVNIVMWKAGQGAEALVAGSGYGTRGGENEARGLQKAMTSPIQVLPDQEQVWISKAVYDNGKWKVVLLRPTGSVGDYTPNLAPGDTVSLAFALWDGSRYERAGSKVTSGWTTMMLEAPVTAVAQQPAEQPQEEQAPAAEQPAEQQEPEVVIQPAATGTVKAVVVGFIVAVLMALILVAVLYQKGVIKGGAGK